MLVFWNGVVGWILHGILKLSSTISESPRRRPEREQNPKRYSQVLIVYTSFGCR
jgi:hypothetical protein